MEWINGGVRGCWGELEGEACSELRGGMGCYVNW